MLTEIQLAAISERAGIHGSLTGQPVPRDKEQRLYYGLLEILDYECCKYGDAPDGVTEDDIKLYLIEHKDKIKQTAISSYMGLACGVFNFLGKD